MKLNVAPTKSNSFELKRNLEFATEGFELLEQKRQILVFEMMSRLERVRTIQKETDEASRTAEIVIMTHPALESSVRKAMDATEPLLVVKDIGNLIRVLD